ncbi:MAG: DNA-binding protein [Gammaproteobacteria bacterium]|jgi:transcriptional regulator with XRE-family HTH domain|nr:DNA-binding protein [Gammaproteobacteria bacterium]|tara:strand:- start:127 stop:690 length:564 start_codon:yes stop_codon:yes gene_type:complete
MSNPISDGIRRLRLIHKLTQTELAEIAGIPRATLANMERPASNPSISGVVKVARALGVTVEDLITKQQAPFVTQVERKDMQVVRQDDGKYVSTRVSPINIPYTLVGDISMLPGCQTRGMPHPDGSHEMFLCLEGTATIVIQDEAFEVEAGDLIHFPGNLPHDYSNTGLKPVHAVSVVSIVKARHGKT